MDFKTIIIAWIAFLFVRYEHPDFIAKVASDLIIKIASVSWPTAQFILNAVDFYSENYYLWMATCVLTTLLISFGVAQLREASH